MLQLHENATRIAHPRRAYAEVLHEEDLSPALRELVGDPMGPLPMGIPVFARERDDIERKTHDAAEVSGES
jgi:hypothetical protein